jgi:hypothetical protein
MSELPDKLWVRRGEARAYLGISEQAFTKLLASGALQPVYFPGGARALFEQKAVRELMKTTKETKGTKP